MFVGGDPSTGTDTARTFPVSWASSDTISRCSGCRFAGGWSGGRGWFSFRRRDFVCVFKRLEPNRFGRFDSALALPTTGDGVLDLNGEVSVGAQVLDNVSN